MGVRFGRVALTFASSAAKPPLQTGRAIRFEGFERIFVLDVVAGTGRQFDITQLFQHTPHGRLIERDCKFLMQPLNQIDQRPANDAMDCRDRTTFYHLDKRTTLRIIEPKPRRRELVDGNRMIGRPGRRGRNRHGAVGAASGRLLRIGPILRAGKQRGDASGPVVVWLPNVRYDTARTNCALPSRRAYKHTSGLAAALLLRLHQISLNSCHLNPRTG